MLNLHPSTIGEPHWVQMQPGDLSTSLTQWYDIRCQPKRWRTVPWVTQAYPCRMDVNWRKPVTFCAKVSAVWAALPKLFRYYVLRKRP